MRIAVINETSAADRNADIMEALEGRGHELVNCGMRRGGEPPELTYIHTGLVAALVLGSGAADFVVGGCGTGQGFLNSVLCYSGVSCGHLLSPLDAWLFARINGGNCVSLALNQGYGWAGSVNLRLVFDQLFTPERGQGYPEPRRESQAKSRELLGRVSSITRRSLAEILAALPDEVALPALRFPGVRELVLGGPRAAGDLARAVEERLGR